MATRPSVGHTSSGRPPEGGRPAPAQGGSLSPHRRARRDRGQETRAQLISAALDVFGRYGFEGATTRQIAQAAGVNLAAIVYHFGGKEALHVAVAEHVAENIHSHLQPVMAGQAAPTSPAQARTVFAALVGALTDVVLGTAEAERWARFIIREQMHPSPAFDAIYRIMGPTLATITDLVAMALSRPVDEEIKIRALTIMGQILVFRFANALARRRLNWSEIGDNERAIIKRIVISQANNIFTAEAST